MKRYRHLDFFTGLAGFSQAFEGAGFETVAFSEIDPFCCELLAQRYPHIPNLGDISRSDEWPWEDGLKDIDVVTFGSPCQDLSIAGKRGGLVGKRSVLFYEAVRAIRRCRPRFALWENVPGAFSSNRGWDFAAVLDEMADLGAVDICWRVLDAQGYGVPQRRRRIFLVADFGAECAGEILLEPVGLPRNIAKGLQAREGAASKVGGGDSRSGGTLAPDAANPLGGGSGERGWRDDLDHSTYIPILEAEGRQDKTASKRDGLGIGREGDPMFTLQSAHQHGVAVPIQDGRNRDKAQNGMGVGEEGDPGYTVDTTGAGSVAQGFHWHRSNLADTEIQNDAVPTLNGGESMGVLFDPDAAQAPRHYGEPIPEDAEAVGLHENQRAEMRATPSVPELTRGGGKPGQGYGAVAFEPRIARNGRGAPSDTVNALKAEAGSTGRGDAAPHVKSGMMVRRLTPTECEKLQGMPVKWTDIIVTTTTKSGKVTTKRASDGPRYRALGNAVAVPVAAWIAKRMMAVLLREADAG